MFIQKNTQAWNPSDANKLNELKILEAEQKQISRDDSQKINSTPHRPYD
jgi:hypothetical protein